MINRWTEWELTSFGDKRRGSFLNARRALESFSDDDHECCVSIRDYADMIESRFGYRPTVKALRMMLDVLREQEQYNGS